MPKIKTNSGAKKRFALHSHILTKKTKKQKRNLVHSGLVANANLDQVKELLCMK